jgi:hypothetical protein
VSYLNPPTHKKSREERAQCRSCTRPKYTEASNVDCYWHWLIRQTPAVADLESWRRTKTVQSPVEPFGDLCSSCGWIVPDLYQPRTGRMCKGCLSFRKYASHVMITYGLSEEDYVRLFHLQAGRCAICRSEQRIKRLAVDHDHETDEVRGLLCQDCNEAVLGSLGGHTRVVLPLLRSAVAYLETFPSRGEWRRPEQVDPGAWSARRKSLPPSHDPVLGGSARAGDDAPPY